MKILLFKRPTLIGLLLPFLFLCARTPLPQTHRRHHVYYNIILVRAASPQRGKKSKAISPFCIYQRREPVAAVAAASSNSSSITLLITRLLVQRVFIRPFHRRVVYIRIIYPSPRGAFKCIIIYVYTMILLTSPFRYYIIYIIIYTRSFLQYDYCSVDAKR